MHESVQEMLQYPQLSRLYWIELCEGLQSPKSKNYNDYKLKCVFLTSW